MPSVVTQMRLLINCSSLSQPLINKLPSRALSINQYPPRLHGEFAATSLLSLSRTLTLAKPLHPPQTLIFLCDGCTPRVSQSADRKRELLLLVKLSMRKLCSVLRLFILHLHFQRAFFSFLEEIWQQVTAMSLCFQLRPLIGISDKDLFFQIPVLYCFAIIWLVFVTTQYCQVLAMLLDLKSEERIAFRNHTVSILFVVSVFMLLYSINCNLSVFLLSYFLCFGWSPSVRQMLVCDFIFSLVSFTFTCLRFWKELFRVSRFLSGRP